MQCAGGWLSWASLEEQCVVSGPWLFPPRKRTLTFLGFTNAPGSGSFSYFHAVTSVVLDMARPGDSAWDESIPICNRVHLVSSWITRKSDLIAILKNIVIAVLVMNIIKIILASSRSAFCTLPLVLQRPMHSTETNRTTNSESLWTASLRKVSYQWASEVDNEIRRQTDDRLVLLFCSEGISGRISWINLAVK